LHSNLALSESAVFLDTGSLSGDARIVVSGSVPELVLARRKHFSPRQSQILSLMAEGLSDKEIARKIGISYPTVRTHVDRIFRDNGLRNRTEAVAVWLNRPNARG
jgi:DNA-binding NarL/FixJ family response regulator